MNNNQLGIDIESMKKDSDNFNLINECKEDLLDFEFDKNGTGLSKETNPFPVDIFPDVIQEIIAETNASLNFPIDYIGASLLFSVSVGIGNTYRLRVKNSWVEYAVLYISIVGSAGTNKSHPLSFAISPINKMDELNFQKYCNERKEFDPKQNNKQKPVLDQLLVSDFTQEAIVDVHSHNKRGIGVYVDELASWFNNFNRYSKGSEEQFWLSNWSSKPLRTNRKTSDPTFIQMPFISVIGTIQPGVIDELARNRTENGFLDRILFVLPDEVKRYPLNDKELNPQISENWEKIISKLLNMPLDKDENGGLRPNTLEFTKEAREALIEWQTDLTSKSNKTEDEALKGIYAKMDMYAIRFSLCLELLHFASGEQPNAITGQTKVHNVGIQSVRGALKLTEYFIKTAIAVNSIVSNNDPIGRLTKKEVEVYNSLPEEFVTALGVERAKSIGMPKRTFMRFISNKYLFIKVQHGVYEKLIM